MLNSTVNNIDTDADTNTPWYSSWKNRSKCQKISIVTLLVLLIFILFISLTFILLYEKLEVCSNLGCVRASKELANYVDPKANPCEDFYRFACGNFLQNTNLDNRGSRSAQDIMEDEIQFEIRNMLERPIRPQEDTRAINLAKKFYRACTNESAIEVEGLKKIKQIFRLMGGWPTLEGSNWREEEFDWKEAVYKLREIGVDFDFFFGVTVDRDKKDGSGYILGIHEVMYTPSGISSTVKDMYLDYMVEVALFFGSRSPMVRKDSENVLNLLLKMTKISEETAALNLTNINEVYSLLELHDKFRSISWFQYLNRFVQPVDFITFDDSVMVEEPFYLRRLEMLLQDTSNRTLANFIAWHTLQHLINYLPAKLLDKAYEYLGKVSGRMMKPPRWKTCVKVTEERMQSVISTAYIKHFFPDSTQEKVLKLLRDIKTQFQNNLQRQDWLDRKTKEAILKALISSTEELVLYEDLRDALEETKLYERVQVYEDKLLESALNLDLINLNIKFSKLRKPFKDNWLKNNSFVTGVNIYYSPKENILRFPIGIFRGIYYQIDRPEYMNYAVLGSIIAHEISHIFIEAEYRDAPGELRSRWSPKSLLNYDEKLQCLANQYGNFEVAELGKRLNPLKTRDEDMADLAGMKVSYDTYIKWVQENGAEPRLPGLNYSPNQLFWISSAIRHCSKYSTQTLERYIANYRWSPPPYRVNGPLQNIEEFAFDFGCPVGSKMNPEVKCEVW